MKKRNYSILMSVIVLVICCAVMVGCGRSLAPSGVITSQPTSESSSQTAASTELGGVLLVKVNPEIAVAYDEAGLVTGIAGRNPEGAAVIENYANYAGKDCRTVISELVAAIGEAGYFVEDADNERRVINLELEAGSVIPNAAFLENIVTGVEAKVAEKQWNGTVKLDSSAGEMPVSSATPSAGASDTDIGVEKAKNIALNHAGVTASEVTFTRAGKDYDDGRWLYEVEFYSKSMEYDYEIDSTTGAILSYDHDAEYYTKPQTNAGSNANYIGVEAAKTAALNHAGVMAASVTFARTGMDYDDGRWIYEVEFYGPNMEYDYDIDATTGAVLSYDHDAEYYTKPQSSAGSSSTSYIGVEAAKNIALNHAGMAAGAVSFSKAKFEDDDGRKEYEIQFHSNGMEYEYTIDAVTGSILEYDSELGD